MTPQQFKSARIEIGFSVVMMADALGVSERTVRRWEIDRGKSKDVTPPPSIVVEVQQLLEGCGHA